ncbi:MAG TPA: PAS domain S-box protein [Planctomycetaceae bacterium]|nr:PAS domain S-box protein [Planctomycetaceae bacterium]
MIARDVTARRKAEQQLRESEEKFRALAESLPAMVTIQRDSRPLYVNPAISALSGYSLDELQHMDFVDLLRREYRTEARQQVHLCLMKSLAWRREVSLCTKAGEERQIDLSVTPITLEGRPAWLASAMDVTERRQAEAELRQLNAELFHSARLRLLGEFVAGVAHDLKHPLGAIDHLASGIINRLSNDEPLTTENLQAEFETVLSQTERAITSITRLQDLARRSETDRRLIDLAPLVSDATRLLKLNRDWSHVPIVLVTDPTRPSAFADRAEITQVLLDLMRNGLEAMQDTPEHERRLTVTLGRHESGWLRLSVTDCGEGVPDEFRSKLFQAFNTTKSEGLGIGLSLCHTIIVDRHQGKLWFEPATPRGSTFHMLIPTATTPSHAE